MADYPLGPKVGQGTFAEVFIGNKDDKSYAVKVLKPRGNKNPLVRREVTTYQILKDAPNIVQLYNLVRDPNDQNKVGMVMEQVIQEDFRSLYPRLTTEDIKYYMYMILMAIDHAHSKGIMHRDIKPENIAIDPETRRVRILDWGTSDFYTPNGKFDPYTGTPNFRPPEVLLWDSQYHYGWDIWSVGCVFASMVFNKFPLYTYGSFVPVLKQINEHLGTAGLIDMMDKHEIRWPFDEKLQWQNGEGWAKFINDDNKHKVDEEVLDLLDKFFIYDFEQRITAKEAMFHPYFNSVRDFLNQNDVYDLLYSGYEAQKPEEKSFLGADIDEIVRL